MATSQSMTRLNIVLPEPLLNELKELVPARQRGRFIAEALEGALRRKRLLAVLDETAGAWTDENHPEMADGPAIDRWIEENRRSARWDELMDS